MLGNFNLQLTLPATTLDGAADLAGAGATRGSAGAGAQLPFSQLLGLRPGITAGQDGAGGEFLPEGGKLLPLFDATSPRGDLRNPLEHNMPVTIAMIDAAAAELTDLMPLADLDVDIEVAYPASEIPLDGTEPIAISAMVEPAVRQPAASDPRTEAATGTRNDALSSTRPTLLAEPQPSVTQAQNTAPAATTVVPPNVEVLVRDKGAQAPVPLTVGAEAGDMPGDEVMTTLTRGVAAIETMAQPDTRVAALASAPSATPAQLSATASQFAAEPALGRSQALLDSINTPVRDAAWGDKLGERVLTLAGNQQKTAEIRLSPADLGPLRVQVNVDDGAANVTFHAQQAATREAIEQALPRLREMLSESGLSLGQADVSERGVTDGGSNEEFESAATLAGETTDEPGDTDPVERRKTVTSSNLLDTFV